MALQQRVAVLEGQVYEISKVLERFDVRLGAVESRLGKVETRLDGVEIRLNELSGRMSAVEARLAPIDARLEGLDRRLESMQSQVARQFTWMVGLFILTLTSVIGTFLAR